MAIMNLNGSGVDVPDAIVPMVQAQLDKDANTIANLESTVGDSVKQIDTLQATVDANKDVVVDLEAKVADAESSTVDVEAVLAFRKSVTIVDSEYDCAGKPEMDVKRDIVQANVGDSMAIADKSDDYVSARFDILVESVSTADSSGDDKMSGAFKEASADLGDAVSACDKARADKVQRSKDAWKTKA